VSYSIDNGVTWVGWLAGFKHVHMMDKFTGCGIDTSNNIWELNISEGEKLAMPVIPSGSPIECLTFHQDPATFVLNSNGTMYYMDPNNTTWATVAATTTYSHMTGSSRTLVQTLDAAGHPYHWNINATYITGTTSGTYANWSGMNPALQPTPKHTVSLGLCFPHGVNCTTTSQGPLDYRTNFNVQAWDASSGCDGVYGTPSDPECAPVTTGTEYCSQGGHIADPPASDTFKGFVSVENVEWVQNAGFQGPVLTGTAVSGEVSGTVDSSQQNACYQTGGGVATCPVGDTKTSLYLIHEKDAWWWRNDKFPPTAQQISMRLVNDWMDRAEAGETSPWQIDRAYIMFNGVKTCLPPIPGVGIEAFDGDYEAMGPCL